MVPTFSNVPNRTRVHEQRYLPLHFFIKRKGNELYIIAVYFDDLNILGTPKSCNKLADILDAEFEMKHLGPTSMCIGIKLAHSTGGVLMHHL